SGAAPEVAVLEAHGAGSLEDDPRRERSGLDLEVRTSAHRAEVCVRRRPASAPMDVAIERGEALLTVAVHVLRQVVSRLLRRLEEGAEEGIGRRPPLEDQRPRMT